jgi:prepilin-type N-terminal cleavage/methylation domain-containing protein
MIIYIKRKSHGFSLLELLIVLGIAGILFAFILPRAWRARVDAQYSIVRQAAVELGRWSMEWSERSLESQGDNDSCVLNHYLDSLIGYVGGKHSGTVENNWFGAVNDLTGSCRAAGNPVDFTVDDIMEAESRPRNPFNGLVYLHPAHDGSKTEPGLLYLASILDSDGFNNYYFVFTGADATSAIDWFAGMGDGVPVSFEGARNGVFVTRVRP